MTILIRIAFLLTGLVATVLNGMVFLIFTKCSKLRENTFLFLYNLCVSDFCVGLAAIFQFAVHWIYDLDQNHSQQYRVLLKCGLAFIMFSFSSSIFHLLSMTLCRLISVRAPLSYASLIPRRRMIVMATVSWCLGLVVFSLYLYLGMTMPILGIFHAYFMTITISIASMIMMVSYLLIFRELWKQVKSIKRVQPSIRFHSSCEIQSGESSLSCKDTDKLSKNSNMFTINESTESNEDRCRGSKSSSKKDHKAGAKLCKQSSRDSPSSEITPINEIPGSQDGKFSRDTLTRYSKYEATVSPMHSKKNNRSSSKRSRQLRTKLSKTFSISQSQKGEFRAVCFCFGIVVVFFATWCPSLLVAIGLVTHDVILTSPAVSDFADLTAISGSIVNPVLYFFMNRELLKAFDFTTCHFARSQ